MHANLILFYIIPYSEMGLQMFKNCNIFAAGIEIWCNGSTTDFGSVCPGSNPGISTKNCWSVDQQFFVEISFINGALPQTPRPSDEPQKRLWSVDQGSGNKSWEWELEEPVDKVPDKETGEFSDKKQNHGPAGTGLVETEGYGDNVTDERNPCGEGEPDTPFVNPLLLLLKCLRLYFEPFFNPFPFADPSYPICHDAAEPVAESACEKAAYRVGCRCENRQVEGVGAEREYCSGEEGAEKEAEEAEVLERFHNLSG